MKKKHFYIYLFLFFLFSSPFWGIQLFGRGENSSTKSIPQDLPSRVRRLSMPDTTNAPNDSSAIVLPVDSLSQDSIPQKKNALDAPVSYSAKDSIIFTSDSWGYLFGDSKVDYQTMSITGERISMNMDSSIVHAIYGLDSIGEKFGHPIFKDNDTEYEMESVRYNFKTKKAFIRNVITQQDEGYIIADRAKKNADDSFFMCDGKYTTCDNHEHPHFYFMLKKAKVRPGKNVVTGPVYFVLEDLPLYPIGLPFAFFPFSKKYSSGIIMPSYGDELDRGFSLRDGGYYFAISDYMDLAVTGEIYTKGSWGVAARSTYKKRYKYSGSFNFKYMNTKLESTIEPDTYNSTKDFSVNWSHAQDPKANMYRTISGSVNYQTTSYSRNDIGQWSNQESTNATRRSSVSVSQRFPDSPFSVIANASVNQTMRDSTISVTLPNLVLSMTRIYPFKRKDAVGADKWYEKIQMQYTADLQNSISTKDYLFFKSNLIKDWKNGIKHDIPVSATFNILGNINVTPNFRYTERWYSRKITQEWNGKQNVAADTTYGFHRVYDFNFGVSLDTKLYGFYTPMFKVGKLKTIRHVFSPSISFSAMPDFSDPKFGMYERYRYYDSEGKQVENVYSPYDKEIFGTAPKGKSGSIGFNFENNVEAKFSSDSVDVVKSIIDNLSIRTSYNLMADSLRWADIGVGLRLKLSKTLTVNLNATFDPYTYSYNAEKKTLTKVDQLRIKSKGTIGRLRSTGYSISPNLNQDTFKKLFSKKGKSDADTKKDTDPPSNTDNSQPANNADGPRKSAFDKSEGDEGEYDNDGYLKNEVKWNLGISYNMTYGYTSEIDIPNQEFKRAFTHTLGFNGSIQPTKNWSFSFYSGYDFDAKKLGHMSCTLSRNLHCWNISGTFIPFGPSTSYYVSIRVNSSMLQDVKYEQRSRPSSYDPNWH